MLRVIANVFGMFLYSLLMGTGIILLTKVIDNDFKSPFWLIALSVAFFFLGIELGTRHMRNFVTQPVSSAERKFIYLIAYWSSVPTILISLAFILVILPVKSILHISIGVDSGTGYIISEPYRAICATFFMSWIFNFLFFCAECAILKQRSDEFVN